MAGRPKEAISEYELALTESPDHWSAHFNLADLYMKADQAEQAIEHYREVLRIKPRYVAAQIGLAAGYHVAGREQEAVDQLLETQKDHPENEYVRKIVESVLSDKNANTPTP
jgi:tetratricopeptide (TPR) repeat protein